jgi:N-acetylglucosaminyl-diphospho-decaprenol L-rhamnosyltransferase
MLLSIIIVNYNTAPLTKILVESLLAQMEADGTRLRLSNCPIKRDAQAEIIVVDNDSKDDSTLLLRSDFPEISVISLPVNIGFAGGVNAGIRAAKGNYYLILNPDMVALPGSLNQLVKFMEDNASVGVAGGQLVAPNGDLQTSCFRFYRPMTIVYRRTPLGRTRRGQRELARFVLEDYDRTSPRAVDWLQGSCLMLRARAVQQVGMMDERFFMYFEDVDWCRRFWDAGWQVMFVPTARFSHFHQRSSDRGLILGVLTNWATREHITSAVKYFWKYRGKKIPHLATV